MHNFRVNVRRDRHRQLLGRRDDIIRTLRRVFAGLLGDDSLNRLVSTTTLQGRHVEVLRAYVAYIHQLRPPFADELIRQVLVDHPTVAAAAMGLLAARFDPAATGVSVDQAERTLVAELRAVTDYTADRVLAVFAEVVRATMRTNAFVAEIEEGDALAFKISAEAISLGPDPKPYREIWVYHPEFEGVHLRGGKVARGGLRFSDRADDFRTEIHGLMATQMVKNVLIVPMGAKGGFIVRHPPAGRAELREAGDRYYKQFIRALLSITDNVVDGEVVTPKGIRHAEGDDPYLVVAADKGTAHLSDTANEISMQRGFWLDDAFASGGSNGYDHKATGITARGAWEAAKRNFRELGIDPESDEITAIGVGDMSGDVFGNGLLRSRTVKLKAAFNHIHIFIDPDPDPERSFLERKRLFETPGSAWTDYAADQLSEGGGVWNRQSKEVDLPPAARELLGIGAEDTVSGDEVIKAIMRLRVDLFWMGGIGTYVKSRVESHADVGDKANDAVRIDAGELRCRVFAEGANLAITDRGRADFARKGGQGYTAFLDNSGGVDTSDHEVNIKILFAPLLASETVTRDDRNRLLKEVEDEVCEMVLDNVRSQSRMVSYDVLRSRADLWRYSRALNFLAHEVPFDPDSFSMPGEDELANRFRRGEGLYKCEAAVLGSHAKMLAYRDLLESRDLPEEITRELVKSYFPARVCEKAGDAIFDHLLRREIAATMVVNRIVDNAGASFFTEVMGSTGRGARDVSAAYLRAASYGGVFEVQDELYALEDARLQPVIYEAMRIVQRALENATYFLLDTVDGEDFDATPEQSIALLAQLRGWLQPGQLEALEVRKARLVDGGLAPELAERVRALRYLVVVLDALRAASERGRPAEEMLRIRLAVSSSMHLSALHTELNNMRFESAWDGPAMLALARQLEFHIHKMTLLVEGDDVEGMIARYGLDPVRAQLAQHLEGELSIAAVVMIDNHLRRLLPPKAHTRGREAG
jgi:glutamate dehydrogenase